MERQELQNKYEAGELDDPTELQRLRDEIHTFTGLRVPRSVAEIEEWWSRNKSVFSRRVKPSEESLAEDGGTDEESDESETDNEGDSE